MHLRHVDKHAHPRTQADSLRRLPPHLRLAALRDVLRVASDSEIEPYAIELIPLATIPTEEQTNQRSETLRTLVSLLEPLLAVPRRIARQREASAASNARLLILELWPRLSRSCRRLALSIDNADWPATARELSARPDAAPALAAFIEEADTPEHLDPAVRLLASVDRASADTAEKLLIRFTARTLTTPTSEVPAKLRDPSPGPTPDLDALAESLADALDRQTEHERTGPALAALILLDRPATDPARAALEPITRIAADEQHPAFPVLRRLIRRDDSPATRRIAWRLLTGGPLSMPALERVARAQTVPEHEAVLANTHLLLRPARAHLVSMLSTPKADPGGKGQSPIPASTAPLGPRARRGLPVLLDTLNFEGERRDRLHVEALTDPDGHTRLAHACRAPGPCAVDFCFDPSPEIARYAALRWSIAGVRGAGAQTTSPHHFRLASALARSPHPAVRRIAESEPDATPHTQARRTAYAEQLRAISRTGEPDARIRAILLARRARLLDGWGVTLHEIIRASGSGDGANGRVAATAAAALGDLPGPRPDMTLSLALEHADPRVRANAVESMGRFARTNPSPDPVLIEFKSSPEHRSRANAVRALASIGGEPALPAEDIERMLTDDRPLHRLSGVWLAERVLCRAGCSRDESWQRLARIVASLATTEADAHVKARARRCSRRLLAETKRPARAARSADPAADSARESLRRFAGAGAEKGGAR